MQLSTTNSDSRNYLKPLDASLKKPGRSNATCESRESAVDGFHPCLRRSLTPRAQAQSIISAWQVSLPALRKSRARLDRRSEKNRADKRTCVFPLSRPVRRRVGARGRRYPRCPKNSPDIFEAPVCAVNICRSAQWNLRPPFIISDWPPRVSSLVKRPLKRLWKAERVCERN